MYFFQGSLSLDVGRHGVSVIFGIHEVNMKRYPKNVHRHLARIVSASWQWLRWCLGFGCWAATAGSGESFARKQNNAGQDVGLEEDVDAKEEEENRKESLSDSQQGAAGTGK